MQLNRFFIPLFLALPFWMMAQDNQNTLKKQKVDDPEINFLFDYYEQDGNHSPVTGGKGTEKLENMAPMLMVNVPLDTVNSLHVNVGVDYYTSASSDQIDKYVTKASPNYDKYISSASSEDVRGHFDLVYTRKLKKNHSLNFMGGYSQEFDVKSVNFGLGWSKLSKDENTEFSVKLQSYYDTWLIILPDEHRGDFREYGEYYGNDDDDYATDTRLSNNLNFAFSRVLNKRMQFSLLADVVYQKGLLYTPFHRVYFNGDMLGNDEKILWDFLALDQDYLMNTDVEKLPDSRIKVPLGLRYNYFITDYLVLRTYYRYYWDDFGIQAHTVNLELPVKINRYWSVYPFYRFHTQTASKYFKAFGEAEMVRNSDATSVDFFVPVDEYYTSDYDLSAMQTHKWGLGFKYSPLYGISRTKLNKEASKVLKFKYFAMRYANFQRTNGFKAWTVAFDAGFVLEKKKTDKK